MPKHLYLFPDTNVFIQCKPLEQLDWSSYLEWGSVDLYLTRPVQSEVDAHKGKGSGRLAKRARSVSSTIRSLLESETGFIQVRENSPTVRLFLKHSLKKDDALVDELDYGERDDQLVGIASAFRKSHPDGEVRLLTHDTGPMASAKLVGLAYDIVPVAWLLQPETDENEKRSNSLSAELQRYRQAEPNFQIMIRDHSTFVADGEVFTAEVQLFTALDEEQNLDLLRRLVARYPLAENFGSRESAERVPEGGSANWIVGMMRETFEPATNEEISAYKKRHAEWLGECKAWLGDLHTQLNKRTVWPTLSIQIENNGSRPAESALVTFEINEQMRLMPVYADKDEDASTVDLDLPKPPVVPKGVWKRSRTLQSLMGMAQVSPSQLNRGIDLASLYRGPDRRDPNGVYWKPSRPQHPGPYVELECEQWRHMVEPEPFNLCIRARSQAGTWTSQLVTKVHAANLTNTAQVHYVLRIKVTETSAMQAAEEFVSDLDA